MIKRRLPEMVADASLCHADAALTLIAH